jgi:hypothetical protein
VLTEHIGITLPSDIGVTDARDEVFEKFLKICWDNDIVTVCAAGNDGIGALRTLDMSMYSVKQSNSHLFKLAKFESRFSLKELSLVY